jgi:leukotriene-A4 hydrolase
MPYPIHDYLMALAVRDLEFREMSRRTGVFAESPTIDAAARELEDLDQMLRVSEELFGPYRWERYDVLVLPPSFPVGGMENPCLTFATPTIIAGDKSLTSLIAHEIAHSWSSNLVSNATWEHFWINEGFTVYMERRILEALYGRRRAEMEAALGLQDLQREFARLEARDQALEARGNGRDPNAGYSQVPYEKGALFLRAIEEAVGRQRFDAFLRQFFDAFAFRSITTSQFIEYLRRNLLSEYPEMAAKLPIEDWIHAAGLPGNASLPDSDVLERVEEQGKRWIGGEIALKELHASSWTTQEWLRFLRSLSNGLDASKMAELDQAFRLTDSGNSEIESQWLLMAIRNGYKPAYKRLEEFLNNVGRRKYLKSLYGELVKTPEGKQWARSIYEQASPKYHPISRDAVNSVLN